MNTYKIFEIMKKEWREVFKNKLVLFAVAFLPIMLTALPLYILSSTQGSGEISQAMSSGGQLTGEISSMCEGLTGPDCTQFFLVSQFVLLFLMMPIIIPVTIASYSIVGEKTTRTLEPLLATPLTTIELLAGKALSAVVPALGVTWLSYTVFMYGVHVLASEAIFLKLLAPVWLLAIFGLGPLLSIAGVSIAVMISSRVNDPRVAEQLSSLVVLPLIALFMGQSFGLFTVNESVILWIALLLLLLDAGLLYFATQLFQRETILTRWK